ncbi:MAG TPA: GxxExxY protein, partial [Polyangiaceae bacterium]
MKPESAALRLRGIPFARQVPVAVVYKDSKLGELRVGVLVDEKLVIELKATDALAAVHTAQLLSYLKATRLGLGLLINLNVATLREGIKRVVLSRSPSTAPSQKRLFLADPRCDAR